MIEKIFKKSPILKKSKKIASKSCILINKREFKAFKAEDIAHGINHEIVHQKEKRRIFRIYKANISYYHRVCRNREDNSIQEKIIWINHDEGGEYTRIRLRAAERDGNKLLYWEDYLKGIEGIEPDERYHAYKFDNDSTHASEIKIDDVLDWLSV